MAKYIYEHKNWTGFTWHDKAKNAVFGEVRLMPTLTALTLDVVKSSEIEGELLNYDQVRCSKQPKEVVTLITP